MHSFDCSSFTGNTYLLCVTRHARPHHFLCPSVSLAQERPFYAALTLPQDPSPLMLTVPAFVRSMVTNRMLEVVKVVDQGALCGSIIPWVREAMLTTISASSYPCPYKRGGGAWLFKRLYMEISLS